MKLIVMKLPKILMWFFIGLLGFIVFLWLAEILIDIFFNHAATIDACLDSGRGWDKQKKQCQI